MLAKALRVSIAGGGENKIFDFAYVDENRVDPASTMSKEELSIDHWNYYNGAYNTSLVPLQGSDVESVIQNESSISVGYVNNWADRNVVFYNARIFALEKVSYPTGGYTKINYEVAAKGIRVASLEDNDGQNSMFRYYDYGAPGTPYNNPGYGWVDYYLMDCCGPWGAPPGAFPSTRIRTYTSSPYSTNDYFGDLGLFYENVTEFIGTPDGQGGKTTYNFMRTYSGNVFLMEKTVYKYGSTDPVHKETNNYTFEFTRDIDYWRVPEMMGIGVNTGFCNNDLQNRDGCCPSDPQVSYILGEFNCGISGFDCFWVKLSSKTVFDGQLTRTIMYGYKDVVPATGLPRLTAPVSSEETSSNGQLRKTLMYYPGDTDPDNASITLGLPQMWQQYTANYKHMLAPVLKSATYQGTKLVSTEKTEYTYDAVNDMVLKTGYEFLPTGSTMGKTRYDFSFDNRGRVLNALKDSGERQAYIWSADRLRIIGSATNAAASQIAYTSFESDGLGGWSLGSNPVIAGTGGITGAKVLNGSITKSLPLGNYILHVWSTGNTWVNNVLLTQAPTLQVAGWKCYVVELSSVANVEVRGGNIDEIKIYPKGSELVTFVYDPGKGMIAQGGANGSLIYYEYDAFDRLKLIRDQDGKILKQFDYQYNVNP
ncbi:hypothetical protein ACFOTA_17890 [Chitinophaga sp. GCM10012297]|uniref:YD repeat-containing protein n=1 Tax=Chitinophaga chungangae TaxID=2821488 RepID=A0ABS3YHC5_9BACT|nr:hypothetical protein [Chitinophaga chungangae]MBO9154094.1 hypothetical protein [Chitinophaga chungangae]